MNLDEIFNLENKISKSLKNDLTRFAEKIEKRGNERNLAEHLDSFHKASLSFDGYNNVNNKLKGLPPITNKPDTVDPTHYLARTSPYTGKTPNGKRNIGPIIIHNKGKASRRNYLLIHLDHNSSSSSLYRTSYFGFEVYETFGACPVGFKDESQSSCVVNPLYDIKRHGRKIKGRVLCPKQDRYQPRVVYLIIRDKINSYLVDSVNFQTLITDAFNKFAVEEYGILLAETLKSSGGSILIHAGITGSNKVYTFFENKVKGMIRTAESIYEFDKVGDENLRLFGLLKRLIANKEKLLLMLVMFSLANQSDKILNMKDIINLKTKQRKMLNQFYLSLVSQKITNTLGSLLKMDVSSIVKSIIVKIIVQESYGVLFSQASLFKKTVVKLRIGIVVSLLFLSLDMQGILYDMSASKERLKNNNRKLYNRLSPHDADLLFFLIEPYLERLEKRMICFVKGKLPESWDISKVFTDDLDLSC